MVKLTIVYPVRESGTQSRLEMLLARATESSLKLVVPLEKAEASLKTGNEDRLREDQRRGKSELEVIGPGGDLEITWQPAQGMSCGSKTASGCERRDCRED